MSDLVRLNTIRPHRFVQFEHSKLSGMLMDKPGDSGKAHIMNSDGEITSHYWMVNVREVTLETINNVKGAMNGACNRKACLKPGARHYNIATRAWYCTKCAREIQEFASRDDMVLFECFAKKHGLEVANRSRG